MRHSRQSKQNKGLVIDVGGLIQRLSVAGEAGTHQSIGSKPSIA